MIGSARLVAENTYVFTVDRVHFIQSQVLVSVLTQSISIYFRVGRPPKQPRLSKFQLHFYPRLRGNEAWVEGGGLTAPQAPAGTEGRRGGRASRAWSPQLTPRLGEAAR